MRALERVQSGAAARTTAARGGTGAPTAHRPALALLLGLATCIGGCESASPKQSAPDPKLTIEERALNVRSFELVWQRVREKHWDPNLGGIDWQRVYDEIKPKVESATTLREARGHMQAALDRLNASHFGIIPQHSYKGLNDSDNDADGQIGIRVDVLENRPIVARVRAESPAAAEGVTPGWLIEQVNGEDLSPLIEQLQRTFEDSTLRHLVLSKAVERRLAGPRDSRVTLVFRDARQERRELVLPRVAPPGRRIKFGNLPPTYVEFEARRLPADVGYIAFNMFFDPDHLMQHFGQAIERFRDTRGLIIDLRGNPGGLGAMSMGVAGWLVSQADQPLGTMFTRQGNLNFTISPRAETYDGPLAILVDGGTASTAEILAGGLQDLGRARLFGSRTAGAALPSMIERLPNGDGFQYAVADYVSASGRRLEGEGVVPDEQVELTREALLAGHDPVIDAAAAWIARQSAAGPSRSESLEAGVQP